MKVFFLSKILFVASVAATAAAAASFQSKSSSAEEARWLVNTGNWGVLSYTESKEVDETNDNVKEEEEDVNLLRSAVVSFADANGKIFFYLMGKQSSSGVTLTLSEASLEPTSNFKGAACGADGKKDPEDPRCAKLSIQGSLQPCADKLTCQIGKKALFDRHPEMKDWPDDHGFMVHQLDILDVWMIANYGGGGTIPVKDYQAASPKHHPNSFTSTVGKEEDIIDKSDVALLGKDDVPDWNKKVERARWVVAHSLWTTVSTVSVRLKGSPWGNIRSIVDGSSYEQSTGMPVFYLPTPDPTAIDVKKNPTISLTFSEAALAERVDAQGQTCGGLDAMDPLCAQLMITGKAVPMTGDDKASLDKVQAAFGTRHPLAPWLAKGGAHTGGDYYTIQPEYITLLDYYGGATEVSVTDYLQWKVPTTKKKMQQQQQRLRGVVAAE